MSKKSPPFTTSDLGLATALFTYGYPLDYLDKTKPDKVEFYFIQSDGLLTIIQLFWAKQLNIDALTFYNNLRIIKNRIFQD